MGEGGGGAGVGGYLGGGALTMWQEREKVHPGQPQGLRMRPPRPVAGMPGGRAEGGVGIPVGRGGRRGKGPRARARSPPLSLPPCPPLRTHSYTRTPPPLPPRAPPAPPAPLALARSEGSRETSERRPRSAAAAVAAAEAGSAERP